MGRCLSILLVTFVALTATNVAAQQPLPPESAATAFILGRVVDAVTGQPLAGATVTIATARTVPGSAPPAPPTARAGSFGGPTRVMTDDEGRFLFHGLPAGGFTISATRAGYMSGAYGRRVPRPPVAASEPPRPLVLAAGEQKTDVIVALWKHGVIGGRVVDEHGEPMIGVQVRVLRRTFVGGLIRLSQTGNMPATDDRGIYRISTLEPGEYVAAIVFTQATMPASVLESYSAAMRAGDLSFTRMLDARGGAVVRDGVRVGSLVVGSGSQAPGSSLRIRVPALAGSRDGRLMVYPTIYYPAASTPQDAAVIAVNAGEEETNVDFQLRPVPAVHITGTLTGPEGPAPHTGLELLAAGSESLARDDSFEAATTVTDATGAFTFLGVVPGRYLLRALRVPERPLPAPLESSVTTVIRVGSTTISSGMGGARPPERIPDEPSLWASMPLPVGDEGVSGLAVSLRTGARIRGRVQFDGSAKPPTPEQLERMTLTIESSDGRTAGSLATVQARTARVDAAGQLNSYQLPPGAYILRAGTAAPGWTFAGAMIDGRDVSVEPFELAESDVTDLVIRYTDRPSELAGAISIDAQSRDTDLMVVVFPVEPRGWTNYGLNPRRLQSSTPPDTGSFTFRGLPDGEYHVAAIRQDAVRDWRDPAFLKKLAPLATRVKVTEGSTSSVSLKPVDVR
jgi:protocatechuate 3,4-dioxygenase beta subunit